MPKHSLREQMLEHRCRLTAATLQQLSDLIQSQFVELPEFLAADVVALYAPVRNEVATAELFRAGRKMGKRLLFPRVFGKHLEFVEVSDWSELHSGAFGIAEPTGSNVVDSAAIDLMVLPGLAFDRRGHRLGYGKGYYDRYWQQQPRHGLLLGLAFDFQVVDRLPVEHHDIQLDLLVTETSLLRFV
ncbi:MAG: 5-formyltetrahydrofolate cyclo-ligase [Desulfuromonadales bacterium GWC2_61_20]|nr:MAG: 5-formyltetrahydrofolate cyclo-ligase [Desulfuromonadales bacterium GWC2_61_20]HAD05206.1 5-formyltetrahydrofolate cyclo-ligase [Desulfuromonas sp.]HBT83473.1 5-formyltetrahydrofolate cyclo-ligase [Desulfuromonas sp.]